MRDNHLDRSCRLLNIIKWVFLASVVGIGVGFATTTFLAALDMASGWTARYTHSFLLLPAAFLVSTLTIKYFAPEAKGHGTEEVIEAIRQRSVKINPLVAPIKLVSTVVTIAAGGSAGKKGPCAQIGAALSSLLADLFGLAASI